VAMRNLPLFYFLFFCALSYSQEKRKTITGKVFFNEDAISDVHIINKNSNQGTNTNDFGLFEIPIFVGDTLEFTHINLKKEAFFITKEILAQEILKIDLQEKTYELEEITLEKPRSIFYVDPEIMPPPTVNAKTLNLPYANTIAKKDYGVVKFRSGGVVSLDNLINALNGNNRRRKLLKKITYEDNILAEIREHFTDDFFITDLNIKPENINPFLNYCFKKNIINHFNKKENIKLTRVLMRESRSFPQEKIEISLVKKK
jgi:hypothetical protein